MRKASLVIYGNVTVREETGGGNNVICFSDINEFDISQAIAIHGDLDVEKITSDGLILIVGGYCVSENLNV